MLYLEDYLEMIEHLPQELRDRFTDMRELELAVHNNMDSFEKRIRTLFTQCRRGELQGASADQEFQAIRKDYLKSLEDADEKVHLSNQMYDLVDRYLRRLDSELFKFKCELEADNNGITEILEKRSLELDGGSSFGAASMAIHSNSQKENRYFGQVSSMAAAAVAAAQTPTGNNHHQHHALNHHQNTHHHHHQKHHHQPHHSSAAASSSSAASAGAGSARERYRTPKSEKRRDSSANTGGPAEKRSAAAAAAAVAAAAAASAATLPGGVAPAGMLNPLPMPAMSATAGVSMVTLQPNIPNALNVAVRPMTPVHLQPSTAGGIPSSVAPAVASGLGLVSTAGGAIAGGVSVTSNNSGSPYNHLQHMGAGNAIAAAASQAIAATQQMQHGRRTASLKASYEAIHGSAGNGHELLMGTGGAGAASRELTGAAHSAAMQSAERGDGLSAGPSTMAYHVNVAAQQQQQQQRRQKKKQQQQAAAAAAAAAAVASAGTSSQSNAAVVAASAAVAAQAAGVSTLGSAAGNVTTVLGLPVTGSTITGIHAQAQATMQPMTSAAAASQQTLLLQQSQQQLQHMQQQNAQLQQHQSAMMMSGASTSNSAQQQLFDAASAAQAMGLTATSIQTNVPSPSAGSTSSTLSGGSTTPRMWDSRSAAGGSSGSSAAGNNRNNSLASESLLNDVPMNESEWFDPNEPRYCICNQVSYGDMVACDNDACPFEWFHYPCVGITQSPKGKWYCPKCTAAMKRRGRK